jgi:hypothetical protein
VASGRFTDRLHRTIPDSTQIYTAYAIILDGNYFQSELWLEKHYEFFFTIDTLEDQLHSNSCVSLKHLILVQNSTYS